MKKKIKHFFLYLGMVTGFFYMLLPLYFIHSLNDWEDWIYLICSIAFCIFYYTKVIELDRVLNDSHKHFIEFYKKENPIFKDMDIDTKYQGLLNYTENIFKNIGYEDETETIKNRVEKEIQAMQMQAKKDLETGIDRGRAREMLNKKIITQEQYNEIINNIECLEMLAYYDFKESTLKNNDEE